MNRLAHEAIHRDEMVAQEVTRHGEDHDVMPGTPQLALREKEGLNVTMICLASTCRAKTICQWILS
jgi:hypothetical protein